MAEVIYRSPGVFTTEIDLSQPTVGQPIGIPAGVIGTANRGPAFVPITVADITSFAAVFGNSGGNQFGPMAVNEYLKNAKALTYMRVLGAGDGKQRSAITGKVTNAGFVVGNQQVQNNGVVGRNQQATSQLSDMGRTYFLGCLMSESNGQTYFSDAGIQEGKRAGGSSRAAPIIRGVIMTPSGVIATLSGNLTPSAKPGGAGTVFSSIASETNIQGSATGSVNMANSQFVLLLNGHSPTADSPNVITASFDIQSGYFGDVLNRDLTKIREKGHVLYSRYDIDGSLAVVTGSGILNPEFNFGKGRIGTHENVAFLVTGSAPRNTSSTYKPNYESFEDRFSAPKSPFITSQKYGSSPYNLFRAISLDDGTYASGKIKIEIANLKPGTDTAPYGTFDLFIRARADNWLNPKILEKYSGLTLDPSSTRYIARVIGDKLAYFDFDQAESSQKLVVKGDHPVNSNYIRVEMSAEIKAGQVPEDALPVGFRGSTHLVTSGSNPLSSFDDGSPTRVAGQSNYLRRAVEPPVPYRMNVKIGEAPNLKQKPMPWGVRYDMQRNTGKFQNYPPGLSDKSIHFGFSRYYPDFNPSDFNFAVGNNPGAADKQGTVLDCDKFNNNAFSLENIRVVTGSDSNRRANPDQWKQAEYVRNGSITVNETTKTRAWKVSDLKMSANRNYSKFLVMMQGGFDGVNVFDKHQTNLTNTSAKREMDDSTNQGGVEGPTVAGFRQALDIMGTKADVDIQLLAIPGMRHSSITDYAIDVVESRFDAMYIMDIEERDAFNTVVTGTLPEGESVNVTYTTEAFKGRALDTSFTAAYFPDVQVNVYDRPAKIADVPPSVVVLGAFSQNDSIGYSWFAPAGFTRGTLGSALKSLVPLVKDNMDNLYDADINPITSFPSTGLMVYGQKTLLADASALDRVNVRRLLIEIRRRVKAVANLMLFEPNRQETLDKFNSLVQPIMQQIQERSGVDRFKVVIDSTTTTQADIENNTLRGKIFLQPTRTAEFVALDFVVANAGDSFDNA